MRKTEKRKKKYFFFLKNLQNLNIFFDMVQKKGNQIAQYDELNLCAKIYRAISILNEILCMHAKSLHKQLNSKCG